MIPRPLTDLRALAALASSALLALALTAACGASDSSPHAAGTETQEAAPSAAGYDSADASPWPRLSVESDAEIERFVADVLSRMSLERKVGQIIQAEIKHVTPEDVRDYALGSVLNGGGSFPGDDPQAGVADWSELSRRLHAAALEAGGGDPAIPLLWGTDAVHGHNNVFGATLFPHNIGLGATRDAELVRAIGRATAEQVAATGIDWNFAPTLAVARDLRWGRAYESFSSDPALVTELGRAAIEGLQGSRGEGFLIPPHVLATAKHFVGDGGTFEGVDQGDARLSEAELAEIHGRPYPEAIRAGVQTVMASFSSVNGDKMHGHRYLLTEVLKNRMGFDGFVIGDWNGHGQVPGCTITDCLTALEAGVDLFMVPEDWKAFRDTLLEHAQSGRLPMARLDDAVRRILRVKKRAGLFDRPVPEGSAELPETQAHVALARRAVRQSLVLLKNDGGVLPVDPGGKILVVGEAADDVGQQSGGWTLDWQGVDNDNARFPNATSIFDALAEQVGAAGGEIALGDAAPEGFDPDVIIAVFGETPYAEGQGDLGTLEFQAGTREALGLLERAGARGRPIVSVFLSGRPLWTNPEINRSDAFVAAWLPGTEGGGVADLLLRAADGSVQHDFTGRLSFAWPAAPVADASGAFTALFERGYGLGVGSDGSVGDLPEDAMAPLREDLVPETGDWVLFDGAAQAPWRLSVRGHNNGADPQVELTDFRVQGDARRVTWSAGAPGTVALVARPPVDLESFVNDNAVVTYRLRVEGPAPDRVEASMGCGEDCADKRVDLAETLGELPPGQWRALRIDLACYARQSAGLAGVERIELLRVASEARISFADVRIEREGLAEADILCPR